MKADQHGNACEISMERLGDMRKRLNPAFIYEVVDAYGDSYHTLGFFFDINSAMKVIEEGCTPDKAFTETGEDTDYEEIQILRKPFGQISYYGSKVVFSLSRERSYCEEHDCYDWVVVDYFCNNTNFEEPQ